MLIVEKAAWAKFFAKLMFFPQFCKFTDVFWTEKTCSSPHLSQSGAIVPTTTACFGRNVCSVAVTVVLLHRQKQKSTSNQ